MKRRTFIASLVTAGAAGAAGMLGARYFQTQKTRTQPGGLAVGDGVTGVGVGDEVLGWVTRAAFAQHAVVHVGQLVLMSRPGESGGFVWCQPASAKRVR